MKVLAGLAGPLYFVLIGVEYLVARRRGLPLYRLNDAINSVSTGLLMQLTVMAFGGIMAASYIGLYTAARIADWSSQSAATWLCCFAAVDFAYYWFHRLSHEVNFLWAAHVVHHQSEDYNLAVALRQSTLQPFFSTIFYLPLALCGFPPLVFFVCSGLNTIYQFWLHTQLIDRLGPLEAILVTPSHHRVHHGRNPIYIDRNHGGTFIVWDRLFGTFQREEEEVVYGITKPLASWNPIWANLHYWVELVDNARRARGLADKIKTFVKIPGWFPEDQGGFRAPPPIEDEPVKFDRAYSREVAGYAKVQFVLLTAVTVALTFTAESHGFAVAAAGWFGIGWGLANLGGFFEGRSWAFRSEAIRVLVCPVAPWVLLEGSVAAAWVAVLSLGTAAFASQMFEQRGAFLDSETPR
ncbi:MAG: sterol desaturase family protein [Myxococcota bacterium]|jgi:sterol desaturase/sphingolipid hydroxylase (fatty acid hydroxylase superfamily)|nr:sterol desaturase family protein [Myxococcota bacterium]